LYHDGAVRDRVALFVLDLDNDYQADMHRSALAAAGRNPLRLEVHDGGKRAETQRAQIQQAIVGPARGELAALLVHPVFDGLHESEARDAARAGIGWVLLNREADYADDLRGLYPRLPLFSVTPDQTAIGRAQGELIRALLPAGGRVLSITGPLQAFSARARRAGMEELLIGSAVQTVCVQADWSERGGEDAVAHWAARVVGTIRHPVFQSFFPDLVAVQNDAMARGAQRALRALIVSRRWKQLEGIPVIGCDGTTAGGMQLVRDGILAPTVVVPATAATAVDLLAAHRDRGTLPPAHVRLDVTTFPDVKTLRAAAPDAASGS
jgi:ABC-type sugar transport system substrate-binding protein